MKCFYCDGSLGNNTLLETLPMGRRFAFDAGTARLWIVCPGCERWNLTPLDEVERRAAVAQLEQFYRAAPHAESNGAGIARVGDVSLIRVGDATLAQYSAWRYSGRVLKRRRDWIIGMVIGLPVVAMLWTPFGDALLDSWWALAGLMLLTAAAVWWLGLRPAFHLRDQEGRRRAVRFDHLRHTELHVDANGWRLVMRRDGGSTAIEGAAALRWLPRILAHIHPRGATEAGIREALESIERAGGPQRFVATNLSPAVLGSGSHRVRELPQAFALALEIACQEEAERQVLHGEAAQLQRDYARADLTARIAEEITG